MNYKSGFTLIELLVVIAIIGILAAIIFSSLRDARDGGVASKVKSELVALSKRAAIEEMETYSYDAVCGSNSVSISPEVSLIIDSLTAFAPEPVVCNSDTDSYAVSAGTAVGTYWCVDSLNNSKEISAPLDPLVPELVCP